MTETSNNGDGDIYKAAADKFATQRERADAWLAGLKVGDQVAIYRGYSSRTPDVAKITGQTSRYWRVGEHQRFRKDTGRMVGGSRWHSAWFAEPTPDIFEAAEKLRLVQRLDGVHWRKRSLETLRTMVALLDAENVTTVTD